MSAVSLSVMRLVAWYRSGLSAQHEYGWEAGRLVSQRQRIYGNDGRELLLNQQHTLCYDHAGRLTQLALDDNTPLTFTYDARQQLSELRYSDAFRQSFSYTRRGLLSQSRMQVKGRRAH